MARQRLWWLSPLIFVGLLILISANSAQWVFLSRVQWVALLGLTTLPLLAYTSLRELLIGAYDLSNRRAGFHVGFLLILAATSNIDTAYIAQKYGQERLREALGQLFIPWWGWILLVSVMIVANAWAAFVATDPKIRGQMVFGLISGLLVGVGGWLFLDFFVAREISFLLEPAVISCPLIHVCADFIKSPASRLAVILPSWISSGYFRIDGNALVIGLGHIRAAVCFLATTLLYFWFKNQTAPALVLFSASDDCRRVEPFRALIFPRCLSDPSFCSNRSLVICRGASPESRSFLSDP